MRDNTNCILPGYSTLLNGADKKDEYVLAIITLKTKAKDLWDAKISLINLLLSNWLVVFVFLYCVFIYV